MTNEQIAEIAEGLTKAQREGLLGEFLGGAWRVTRCRRILVEKGLCEPNTRALTPLGLAVRDYLEGNGK